MSRSAAPLAAASTPPPSLLSHQLLPKSPLTQKTSQRDGIAAFQTGCLGSARDATEQTETW